jgi:hypothetical protein
MTKHLDNIIMKFEWNKDKNMEYLLKKEKNMIILTLVMVLEVGFINLKKYLPR